MKKMHSCVSKQYALWVSMLLILQMVMTESQAQYIPSRYQKIATQHNIPASILYAVALTESGKVLKSGQFRPWPWTLNVEGKAKRYATRKAAWFALKQYMDQGIRSIDIGLMQVNWYWNKDKLANNTWKALDPVFNVETGARILQEVYQQKGNWAQAIGRYHSPGQTAQQKHRALVYTRKVIRHIKTITGQ